MEDDATDISPGYVRLGMLSLFDAEGNEVGSSHFVSHVTAVTDDTHVLVGNGHYTFEAGNLSWSGYYTLTDTAKAGPPEHEVTVAIVGGTGVFEGARGTLTWRYEADGHRWAVFTISC